MLPYKKNWLCLPTYGDKLNTLILYLGKQMQESCKIEDDKEITDYAKKEMNKCRVSRVYKLNFWIASRILCHTGKYLSDIEGRLSRYAE